MFSPDVGASLQGLWKQLDQGNISVLELYLGHIMKPYS